MRPIPTHEPEIVEFIANHKFFGDDEKVPTTSVKGCEFDGVAISSRYDKAHELELMRTMIATLSSDLRKPVSTIFCDSKANACYSVDLRPCTKAKAKQIAFYLELACLNASSGHNGIVINGSAGESIWLDPQWPGNDAYYA